MSTLGCDDPETEYLVSGYIRGMQQLFPSNRTFYIIPEIINYECLKFYFVPEQFVKCGSKMKIRDNNMVVAYDAFNSYPYQTAYGSRSINGNNLKYNYCWIFKISRNGNGTFIGISSAKEIDVERGIEHQKNNDEFYAYSDGGLKYDLGKNVFNG